MQFETCRKLSSVAENFYATTGNESELGYSLKSLKGVCHLHDATTQNMFLERMVKGMHDRMPVATLRKVPMISIMARYILKDLDIKLAALETRHNRRRLVITTGAYLLITFGYSLQGNDGLWVDTEQLCKHIEVGETDGRSPPLPVKQLERFRGEDED